MNIGLASSLKWALDQNGPKSNIQIGDVMNRKTMLVGTIVLLGSYGSAWTQDTGGDEDAEATIRLMGAAEAELPDAVTKEISLPESKTEDSADVENPAQVLETANKNRLRREEGLTTADEARERGAEMAKDAMENRENRGRSDDLPDRPDVPEPPTPPGPPGGG
jgi:hypothetical protein